MKRQQTYVKIVKEKILLKILTLHCSIGLPYPVTVGLLAMLAFNRTSDYTLSCRTARHARVQLDF
jgi:hypothetical protein